MKRLNYIYILLAFVIVLGACDDEELNTPEATNVPASVAIVGGDQTFVEGKPVKILVRYFGNYPKQPITVNYQVTGDVNQTGSIVFEPDNATQREFITIENPDNSVKEGDRTFTVTLTSAENNVALGSVFTGSKTAVKVTVKEDIKMASLVSGTFDVLENQGKIEIPILLTNALTSDANLGFEVFGGGGAAENEDFVRVTANPLFLPKGTKDTLITVQLDNDVVSEVGEQVFVRLSSLTAVDVSDTETFLVENPDNIDNGRLVGFNIMDDIKELNFATDNADSIAVKKEGNRMVNLVVSLSEPVTETVTATYGISGDVVGGINDRSANPGGVTFSPGETQRIISLELTDGAYVGTPNKFTVTLNSIESNDEEVDTGDTSTVNIYAVEK